jgi:hypothetical protein
MHFVRRLSILIIVSLILVVSWEVYFRCESQNRICNSLKKHLNMYPRKPVDIAISFSFTPEEFHVRMFQNLGRILRVTESAIFLGDVSPSIIKKIARKYWVSQICLYGQGAVVENEKG